jgi:transaldolase/glucose-6-phosphate isomerase
MDNNTGSRNRLAQLSALGTSVWLDFVSRPLLRNGELQRLVEVDDLRGVTSNPSIFEKAIAHGNDYDDDLVAFEKTGDHSVSSLFEHLAIGDIRDAADVLRPVYDRTDGVDGYISLEVSPYLALRTTETIDEARHLWRAVDRKNLMVKVPGTKDGVPAIATLIGEGLNINVTLLFAVDAYKKVAEAYMTGLETLSANGGDLHQAASVASFFISRIDSAIDERVTEKLRSATPEQVEELGKLRGKVAIASAKAAYQLYKDIIASSRWQALAAKGARPQRLLWASTSAKLKGLPDTLYVDALNGPDVVNTMPPATMDAARDHGVIRLTIEDDLDDARATLSRLEQCGISLEEVTQALVDDGVQQFADAADKLYGAVAMKRATVLGGKAPLQTIQLGDKALDDAVAAASERWRAKGLVRKLWSGDKSVWTSGDEDHWVGWLSLVDRAFEQLDTLNAFQAEVSAGGYSDVVLLGMGGSSLGPEVLAETYGHRSGFPRLHIVDSTDPAQLRSVTDAIDLDHSLFIVSSKSGSTLEPNIFKAYFFDLVKKRDPNPGRRFVAVTDPGSSMEKVAHDDGFAHVFHGDPAVGGRFSVLSMFGLVPAAAVGIDLESFLSKTREMVRSCGPDVPPALNPGVQLGIVLGILATHGRDKVTFIASPGISDIGAWLEQLMAESTGKQGRGIVPIDGEPLGAPDVYGSDRLFVYLELADAPDFQQREQVRALEDAKQPVVRITVPDKMHLGQEFFRFEIAVAVAGALIGINPFDQPDVEASKIATRKLMDEVEKGGQLPSEKPFFEADGIQLYADGKNQDVLGPHKSLEGVLRAQFARINPGDYVALLAYLQRDEKTISALRTMRAAIRDARHVATAVGFGPRFLHSTGQAYKGGPNSGVFLQITCHDTQDLAVPGYRYGFSTVKAAQARGDLQVLNDRERRALRVHLTAGVASGLKRLNEAVIAALA